MHACGKLTDLVLRLAASGRAPVAVVPCCHRGLAASRVFAARLGPDIQAPFAMDVARLEVLRGEGYDVEARTLPRDITPQNRVILGRGCS